MGSDDSQCPSHPRIKASGLPNEVGLAVGLGGGVTPAPPLQGEHAPPGGADEEWFRICGGYGPWSMQGGATSDPPTPPPLCPPSPGALLSSGARWGTGRCRPDVGEAPDERLQVTLDVIFVPLTQDLSHARDSLVQPLGFRALGRHGDSEGAEHTPPPAPGPALVASVLVLCRSGGRSGCPDLSWKCARTRTSSGGRWPRPGLGVEGPPRAGQQMGPHPSVPPVSPTTMPMPASAPLPGSPLLSLSGWIARAELGHSH